MIVIIEMKIKSLISKKLKVKYYFYVKINNSIILLSIFNFSIMKYK